MGLVLPLINEFLYVFTTDSNGAADGSTFFVSDAGEVDNFFLGMTCRVLDSPTDSIVNEERECTVYVSATGRFTIDPPLTAQILSNTVIAIIRDRPVLAGASGPMVAFMGVADAGSDTDTLRDAALTQANDFWNGLYVVMLGGDNSGQASRIEDFIAATDDLQLETPFTSAIAAGDPYAIISIPWQGSPIDDTADVLFTQVIGRKGDAAVNTVGVAASIVAYVKSLINQFGNITGHTLTSLAAKFGDSTESLLTTLGITTNAADQTNGAATLSAGNRGIRTSLGNPAAHILTTITAKWGDIARSLDLILGARWDAAGDLGTDIAAIIAAVGSAPVLTKATLGASNFFAGEVFVISLTPAGPSELGGVSASISGFAAGAVVTVRLYKMTNGVEDLFETYTRIAGTDPDGLVLIDSPDIIDGTGALVSWRFSLQSNNAGDVAVTVRYQYTLKRII